MKPTMILTLCYVVRPPRVLLGLKKLRFGAGWYNGFGGKVEGDETIEQAAIREVQEEAGISVSNLTKRAIIMFDSPLWPARREVHYFSTSHFTGEPQETEEMAPVWFPLDSPPFEKMWPVDKYWWPLFMAGKNFRGEALYAEDHRPISHHFEEVNNFI